ncbi:MAG: DUF1177 domain-containing protein [Bacillota bacterium]
MALKQVLEVIELLDHPRASGEMVKQALAQREFLGSVEVVEVASERGKTDFISFRFPGHSGKSRGGSAPTLGIIGRLGGIGARPERLGLVSDGDGAVAAIAAAFRLGQMAAWGDVLSGDVIIATHICPDAPTRPHHPVPFMDSPVNIHTMNQHEVSPEMDGILSIDTTRGNRVINHRGFAISPTVKEGYILRVSERLLDIMEIVTGRVPVVFPLTMQDITPYGNGLYHLNSILQPSCVTTAPVVGVALTAEVPVPGCATGASHAIDIELAARFVIEVAKEFGNGTARLHDDEEFQRIVSLYGNMHHLQGPGRVSGSRCHPFR